jgi:hypothetical protein
VAGEGQFKGVAASRFSVRSVAAGLMQNRSGADGKAHAGAFKLDVLTQVLFDREAQHVAIETGQAWHIVGEDGNEGDGVERQTITGS